MRLPPENNNQGNTVNSDTVNSKLVIATAAMISALVLLYWNFMPVMLGNAAEARGYSESELGFLASAFSGGLFLTTLSGVLWIRRYDWKLLIKAGGFISALAYLVPLFFESYEVFLVCNLFASLGGGIGLCVSYSLIGDTKNPARNYAIAFCASVLLGIIAALALSNIESPILALNSGFILMAAVMLLVIYLTKFIPHKGVKTGRLPDIKSGTVLPRKFAIPFLLVAIVFVFIGDTAIWAFLERIGTAADSRSLGGSLVSANLLGGVLGSAAGAVLGIRWGFSLPMTLAIAVSILSVVMFAFFGEPWVLILASFINGFGWNFGIAYRMGLVAELDMTGRYVVLIPAMQQLGNTLGPVAAGPLIEMGGFNYVYYFASAIWLIALALYMVSHREYTLIRRRSVAAET